MSTSATQSVFEVSYKERGKRGGRLLATVRAVGFCEAINELHRALGKGKDEIDIKQVTKKR